jgi:hypothetical protein
LRQPEANSEVKAERPTPDAEEIDVSMRRELIKRYGKYAIAAAPLLLFASEAHAMMVALERVETGRWCRWLLQDVKNS